MLNETNEKELNPIEQIKTKLPEWAGAVVKKYLLSNVESCLNPDANYASEEAKKAVFAQAQAINQEFADNLDSCDHHANWHQMGVLGHTQLVVDSLKKVPLLLAKEDLELYREINKQLSKKVYDFSKKELLVMAAYLHDIGKFGSRQIKQNQDGSIKIEPNGKPHFSFNRHDKLSGKIIREDLQESLYDKINLHEDEINYVADCAELHYILGDVREKFKKTNLGFSLNFINSYDFVTEVKKYITKYPNYKYEIGIFYLADSLGKYSRQLRKYRNIGLTNRPNLNAAFAEIDVNNAGRFGTRVLKGVSQLNTAIAAGKRYLTLCLQDDKDQVEYWRNYKGGNSESLNNMIFNGGWDL